MRKEEKDGVKGIVRSGSWAERKEAMDEEKRDGKREGEKGLKGR